MLIPSSLPVSQEFQQSRRKDMTGRHVNKDIYRAQEDRREEHAMIPSCARAERACQSPNLP